MKKTLTLLAVLVVVVLLIKVFDGVSRKQSNPMLFKGYKKGKVSQIEISKGENKERLIKKGGGWVATEKGEYPADSGKVAEMLNVLVEQRAKSPISKNPAKHSLFKVDSAGGTRVALSGGEKQNLFYRGPGPGVQRKLFAF